MQASVYASYVAGPGTRPTSPDSSDFMSLLARSKLFAIA